MRFLVIGWFLALAVLNAWTYQLITSQTRSLDTTETRELMGNEWVEKEIRSGLRFRWAPFIMGFGCLGVVIGFLLRTFTQ